MLITQKNQYAIRAVFELAQHAGREPVKTAQIAAAQKIPLRFLEVILSQLQRSGLVLSKRGFTGGYTLALPPHKVSVGDILRHMAKSADSLHCVSCSEPKKCELKGDCAFISMWDRAHQAMLDVFNQTTMQDLINEAGPPPRK